MGISSCTKKEITSDLTTEEVATNRQQSESCHEKLGTDFQSCDFYSVTTTVTIDEYPGCSFEVTYEYYECPVPLTQDLVYYLLDYELLSHDCQEYIDDLNVAQLSGDLAEFSVNFDGLLSEGIFDNILLGVPNAFDNLQVTISYAFATCTNYCYFLGTKNGFEFVTFEKVDCGSACCGLESYYTYQNGTWVFDSTSPFEIINNQDCDDSEILAPCRNGSLFSSDCTFTCDMFSRN